MRFNNNPYDSNNPADYTHIRHTGPLLLRSLYSCTPDNFNKRDIRHVEPGNKQYPDNNLHIHSESRTVCHDSKPYNCNQSDFNPGILKPGALLFRGFNTSASNNFDKWYFRHMEPGNKQYPDNNLYIHSEFRAVCHNNIPDNYHQYEYGSHILNTRTVLLRGIDSCTPDNFNKRDIRNMEPGNKQHPDNNLYIHSEFRAVCHDNIPDNYHQSEYGSHILNARTILLRGNDSSATHNFFKRRKRDLEPGDKQFADNNLHIYACSGPVCHNSFHDHRNYTKYNTCIHHTRTVLLRVHGTCTPDNFHKRDIRHMESCYKQHPDNNLYLYTKCRPVCLNNYSYDNY